MASEPTAEAVCTTTDGHHFYRCVICEAVMDTPLAGLLEVPAEAPRVAELEAALRGIRLAASDQWNYDGHIVKLVDEALPPTPEPST